ncbi:hypothetical protein GR268_43315 [Rhizobium leguminosarum]|nr:hypothetical protein [Rhizobium leguminosarum]
MLDYKKAAALLGFLLANILVASCGCGNDKGIPTNTNVKGTSPNTNVEKSKAEELQQLVAEENELTRKLEGKFVLKHQGEFKQGFARAKNERTVEVWSKEIKELEGVKVGLDSDYVTMLDSHIELVKILKQLIPSFNLISYTLILGIQKSDETIKEIAAEYLLLAINQKKQAELKNK